MRRIAPLFCATLALGCQPGVIDRGVEEVPTGNELNYYSTEAIEYDFEGDSSITLDTSLASASSADKRAAAQRLMGDKTTAIAWFLHIRISPRTLWGGPSGDANRDSYPGFDGIVRIGDWTLSDLRPVDAEQMSYTFHVKIQGAGTPELIDELPGKKLGGGKKVIQLAMAKLGNDELAMVYRDPRFGTGTFDPTTMSPDQLETIALTMSPQPRSSNAYLDLANMISDGRLTVDAHYGYDYLEGYDLSNSHALYDRLIAQGFVSPAPGFAAYEGRLGPLTRTVTMGGRPVSVQVRIFRGAHPGFAGPDASTDTGAQQMERDMRDSLANSDVILFSGHSGPYYGFALANWNVTSYGELDYPQLRTAKMPSDRFQLVMASGCQTFSIGQAFSENPNKPGLANLNVITTIGWSQAGWNKDIDAVVDSLWGDDSAGFDPPSIATMLSALNRSSALDDIYGLHGIDGDPKLHPFARLDRLGQACSSDVDCGGTGNRCTKAGSKKTCSVTCLDDTACPSGYACRPVAASGSNTIASKQCLAR